MLQPSGWVHMEYVGTVCQYVASRRHVETLALYMSVCVVVMFAGNNRYGKAGWVPGQAVPAANDNIVNCLVYNAYMASVPETYTPPCGGTMAVIMMPCDVARATGRVRAMMVRRETYDQVTVTQMPVQCECVVSSACQSLLMC